MNPREANRTFPRLITDTDIRILVVHQTSQRTKEQIVINQLVDRSCMSFKMKRNYRLSNSLHLVNLILILVEYL